MADPTVADTKAAERDARRPEWTPPARPRWRWYHGFIVVAIAAITVMWLYAFSPLPSRKSPMRVDDNQWRSRVNALCTNAQAAIAQLPVARSATSPQNRAATIDQSNSILATMVAALEGDKPATSADIAKLAPWLADYERFLQDRRDYADILRTGKDEPFAQTQSDGGSPISLRMDEFARVNDIPRCKVPKDV